MFTESTSFHLTQELEEGSERVHKQKSTVLFRRGDKAAGMYVVLSGKVTLDYGAESACGRSYGPGALVGLPSTLTLNNYSMTATVTEDAVLSFWSPRRLQLLLRQRPGLCRVLMAILKEKIAENHAMEMRVLSQEDPCNATGDRV